ncbi:hypothetical protein HO133_008801 [Letharia lupina]|uniref:Potassium channel tetramerisation-type BTB domain-containing protein n=1 Tax=Letharia lupina TaxID=560253 RepID=A0A8H6CPR0_9LECA|nr:uncharacterized protein HO133_008801 [Letharia lupina]KAF6227357.1 hypothetical protein HO133_008801 [Letharia lupina]
MTTPTPQTASASAPAPTPSNTMTLQVGECRFVTRPATLTRGSDFFARQLSGRWPDIQPDGSYFIDADGDVFQHVLRYLRHEIMPIFYDNVKGHDYALYLAVLEQARYFGVEPLQKWLEEQKYLQAVKIVHSARVLDGIEDVCGPTGSHVKIEHHVTWKSRKVYVCRRAITGHMGNRDACGRLCRNARGDADDEYEDEEVLKILEVRKTTMLDAKMRVEQR